MIRHCACAAFAGALVVFAAACGGGGGGEKAPVEQAIRRPHFVFMAPGDWVPTQTKRGVTLAPDPKTVELMSVAAFPTIKPYRPSLFQKAIPEIDRAARDYARQLKGTVVSSATVAVAGKPVRQYVVAHGRLHERISFVFRGRTEYFLVCRWSASEDEPAACRRLSATFRPV